MKPSAWLTSIVVAAFFISACDRTAPSPPAPHSNTPPKKFGPTGSTAGPTPPSDVLKNHPANKLAGQNDSSGVVVWVYKDGDLYVLFGKEWLDPAHPTGSAGKWNFMRGKVGPGQTYIKTAHDELEEETAGYYKPSLEDLAKAPYSTFAKGHPFNNLAYTFFFEVANYVDENLMIQENNQRRANGMHSKYSEMTDYQWVKMDVLIGALQHHHRFLTAVASPTHQTPLMEIYDYSFTLLRNALPELQAIAATWYH